VFDPDAWGLGRRWPGGDLVTVLDRIGSKVEAEKIRTASTYRRGVEMIRHTVLVTMKADTSTESMETTVEQARKLPSEIPSLRQIEVGLGANPGNASLGIVALFDDMDGFWEYMEHPAHRAFGQDHIRPFADNITQVQFEI
jgi:hypothetical protein